MSLQGISAQQMIPKLVRDELMQYAADLGLPNDWPKYIETKDYGVFNGMGWSFRYNGRPLIDISVDDTGNIVSRNAFVALPPKPDPLVFATEHELSQPSDPQWRRFCSTVFRLSEVATIECKKNTAGNKRLHITFKCGKELETPNDGNYANSGLSTFEWFLQHVMGLTSKRDEQQRNGEHHAD